MRERPEIALGVGGSPHGDRRGRAAVAESSRRSARARPASPSTNRHPVLGDEHGNRRHHASADLGDGRDDDDGTVRPTVTHASSSWRASGLSSSAPRDEERLTRRPWRKSSPAAEVATESADGLDRAEIVMGHAPCAARWIAARCADRCRSGRGCRSCAPRSLRASASCSSQQRRGRHDLARLAVAALRHLLGDPRLLQRVVAVGRRPSMVVTSCRRRCRPASRRSASARR